MTAVGPWENDAGVSEVQVKLKGSLDANDVQSRREKEEA